MRSKRRALVRAAGDRITPSSSRNSDQRLLTAFLLRGVGNRGGSGLTTSPTSASPLSVPRVARAYELSLKHPPDSDYSVTLITDFRRSLSEHFLGTRFKARAVI